MYKIAVIGNSNSVMRGSYVSLLAKNSEFIIENFSIGSTPNVILLDFLCQVQNLNFDAIIIETCVVDFLYGSASYPRERSKFTLEYFISVIQLHTSAHVIILAIPTRFAIINPEDYWQEGVYEAAARQFGVPILNGFQLVRNLIGPGVYGAGLSRKRVERVVQLLGLPSQSTTPLVWRGLRNRHHDTNALGHLMFSDHAHFSDIGHRLVGELLQSYISNHIATTSVAQASLDVDVLGLVAEVPPINSEMYLRSSSLLTRKLARLLPGGSIEYQCPEGYQVYGVLVNEAFTSGIVQFTSKTTCCRLDMRFPKRDQEWIARVVPILTDLGEGLISAQLLPMHLGVEEVVAIPGAGHRADVSLAEVGSLIVVRRDAADFVKSYNVKPAEGLREYPKIIKIDEAPDSDFIIRNISENLSLTLKSIESDNNLLPSELNSILKGVGLKLSIENGVLAQLQTLFLMDNIQGMLDLLEAASDQIGDLDHAKLKLALLDYKPTEFEGPQDLLKRGRLLVTRGLTVEAEDVFIEGIARYPTEMGFFIEWAWISYHQKNWSRAQFRWSLVHKFFSMHPHGYLGLALSLRGDGQLLRALELLEDAACKFPDHEGIAVELSKIALILRRPDDAIEQIRSKATKFEKNIELQLAFVEALSRGQEFSNAKNELSRLVGAFGSDLRFYHLALRLNNAAPDPEWLAVLWPELIGSVADKSEAVRESCILFRRFKHTAVRANFIEWMIRERWNNASAGLPLFLEAICHAFNSEDLEHVRRTFRPYLAELEGAACFPIANIVLADGFDYSTYRTCLQSLMVCELSQGVFLEILTIVAALRQRDPEFRTTLTSITNDLVGREDLTVGQYEVIHALAWVGSVFNFDDMDALLVKLATRLPNFSGASELSPAISSPFGALRFMADRAVEKRSTSSKPGLSSKGRLQIIVCLSGQLRGYQEAFQTWKATGIYDHDVKFVAHTWEQVGLKLPDNSNNADRVFHGEFLIAFKKTLELHGWQYIRENYPRLVATLDRNAVVDEDSVKKIISSDYVVVERESEPHISGKSNFWKMHYKVMKAQKLATSVYPNSDLYIRARPDQDMSVFGVIDWIKIHEKSRERGVLFSQYSNFFVAKEIWTDDRLAIGCRSPMDIFCDTFSLCEAASVGAVFGVPRGHRPHASFAATSLLNRIEMVGLSADGSFRLLNPRGPSASVIAEAIALDMSHRARVNSDQAMLLAVEADSRSTGP